MISVVGVRFKPNGKIYYFSPDKLSIDSGEKVLVETARGIEYGFVVSGNKKVSDDKVVKPLKSVIRKADEADTYIYNKNKEKSIEAKKICEERAKKFKLDMKIVDADYTFDSTKVIFSFTSGGRVDFRDLVKDLASIFKVRIELKQIGSRDYAKVIGGLGSCGKSLCCNTFLGDFETVSINMAKDQGLSLNTNKISGVCGRLKCCLVYENDVYVEKLKVMPKKGSQIKTEHGMALVIGTRTLTEEITVKATVGTSEEILTYKLEELQAYK